MKSYVITVFGLDYSETSALRCITSGLAFNFPITGYSAVHKFRAELEMQKLGLFLNKSLYKELSDQDIGDRAKTPKGQWTLTTAELGCFLSHYKLWKRSVELQENLIIFEHDAEVIAPIPRLPQGFLAANFHQSSWPTALAYTITPQAASLAIKETHKNGIQPTDELLWRSALKDVPVFVPRETVVKPPESEISTIQWTRSDRQHQHIKKEDPWIDFKGLKPTSSGLKNKGTQAHYKKTISLPTNNRPHYLARTLNSLSKLDTTGYKLFVNIEPHCIANLDLIEQIDFMEVDCQINTEKLGVRQNPFDLIERAFASGSEWNFHIEDDLLFAPDTLALVNWYYENQHDNVLIYGTCNRQHITNNKLDCDVYMNPISFSGLGWCTSKKDWQEHIKKIWFDENSGEHHMEGGWDWNLSRYLRYGPYAEIIPIMSRSTTIGELGTYSSKESHAVFVNLPLSECTKPKYQLLKYPS